jgi:hypothetical protein
MITHVPARSCQFHGGQKNERGFLVFCGKPAKEGYSYCSEHQRKVYQRASGGIPVAPRVIHEVATETEVVAAPEIEREAA